MDYDISLTNPKIKKTLEAIGQDIYRKHGVSNQMLEDFLYEEFDTIGMRILARYMRSLPHVTARFVCFAVSSLRLTFRSYLHTFSIPSTPTVYPLHKTPNPIHCGVIELEQGSACAKPSRFQLLLLAIDLQLCLIILNHTPTLLSKSVPCTPISVGAKHVFPCGLTTGPRDSPCERVLHRPYISLDRMARGNFPLGSIVAG